MFDEHDFPALKAVEDFTREAVAIDREPDVGGKQVVEPRLASRPMHGEPKAIRADRGPEFISNALDL